MKRILYNVWILCMMAALVVSCSDVKIPEPAQLEAGPKLVSSTPADGASRIAKGDLDVILTFDQNVFCPKVGHDKITLTGGNAKIESVVANLTKVTIKVTGVEEGVAYQLIVGEGVVLGPTKLGSDEITINFTTRGFESVVAALSSANPTPEAVNLYKYLVENYRQKMLSGTMAQVNWNTENAEAVHTLTGKYPAMNTFDYVHLHESGSWINYSDITPVKNWSDNNGIVSMMWHWNVPASYEDKTYRLWPSEVVEMPEDWGGNLQLTTDPGTLFGDAKVGDKIVVKTLNVLEGAQGSFKDSGWEPIADGYGWPDITGDYEMDITADILAKLQSGGLIISGRLYEVAAVVLESGGNATALWGELPAFMPGDWSGNLQLIANPSEMFAGAQVGSKIIVKTSDVATGAQGALKGSDWGEIASGYEYFDIDGDFEIVVTEDILEKLQSGGLIVSGHDYTATAVYMVNSGYSSKYGFYKEDTNFDAANATVEDTWEYKVFNEDLAKVATSLKQLQDEGIAVVWRPFHEAAGGWFWWGKDATSFKQNWIAMFDYFAAEGVNNLIWVWTTETEDDEWYPGDAYVDIVGRDLYNKDANAVVDQYNIVDDIYSNRIIALTECGSVGLISEQWAAGARWSWFMPWYTGEDDETSHATDEWWIDAMEQEFVITRDQLPDLK